MLDPELTRRIRLVEITTTRAVDEVLAGLYHSVFKGRGMEFEEVREYVPGDEIRTIDWNVTARTGRPHVKRYVEERQLTILLAVDLSGSTAFGTAPPGRPPATGHNSPATYEKRSLIAEFCALIALAASRNNDRVGLLLFTDRTEHFVPPARGRRHVLRLVRELLAFRPRGRGTDLTVPLAFCNRALSRRATVFLVSDFLGHGFERLLRITGRHHDLVAVAVSDPAEHTLPPAGLLCLADNETGAVRLVDTTSPAVRRAFADQAATRRQRLTALFRRANVDHLFLETGADYLAPLVRFFRERRR